MATAVIEESEDYLTCGVCLEKYDLEERTPKLLRCSHMICLPCAKVIFHESAIRCPFCRIKSFIGRHGCVDSLPNDTYAIRLLERVQRNKQTSESAPSKKGFIKWCLHCESPITSLCPVFDDGNSTIIIHSQVIKNMKQTVELKNELIKMKDRGISTLTEVVEKRKQIRGHLSLVMESIRLVEAKVMKLQDDNELMLAKFKSSILESTKKPISRRTSAVNSYEKRRSFNSEFASIVEDFHPEDSLETLKFKLKKTLNVYEKSLREATFTSSDYDLLKNMKITIALNDGEETEPILTFNLTKQNRNKPEVMLLSHCILSLFGNQIVIPPSANLTTLPKIVKPSSSFVLGQSIFVLKFYSKNSLADEVWIQPCTTFDNEFIQKLGMFCFKTPKELNISIKAVPDVHLTLNAVHELRDYDARAPQKSNPLATKALKKNEIGLEIVQFPTKKNATIEWKMVFPLEKYSEPRFQNRFADNRAELFGNLIKIKPNTLWSISTASKTRSTCFTFTLESF